ncbi:hypothetical protein BWQ96_05235 [Gracilariopsis chorda]|uniref:Uncharacterized protein n=1 Tax=Gracilariopsis chorda TaxID=448386 RepID=A0A2V3IS81_9FLOR|nr:hypothetical protein BWQ96_05235 [Gracilariopsis chorda]|eukprot:PXF44988.1 hypothetical protein BWQ96_05235 [Gracilariopsis chorda]
MIENGTIVYSAEQLPLFTWSTPWPAVNTITIAILTTVLSYQITAAFSDLLLGLKPKGKTSASQIHSQLLSNEKSMVHVLAALLRLDTLDRIRLRHRAKVPSFMAIERHSSSVRFKTIARLVLLLAIPPLMNVLSIVVALERDTFLTVSASNFQGVSVGVLRTPVTDQVRGLGTLACHQVMTSFSENEESLMDFSMCSGFRSSEHSYVGPDTFETALEGEVHGGTLITAVNLPRGSITVSFKHGVAERAYTMWLDVSHEDGIFRTKPRWSVDDAREVVQRASDALVLSCAIEAGQKPEVEGEMKHEIGARGVIRAWSKVGCEGSTNAIILSTTVFAGIIGLVNTEGFWVGEVNAIDGVDGEVAEFFNGESLSLIRRRRSLAPLAVLALSTVAAIVVRLTVKVFANADIDDAIDTVVRRGLRLNSKKNQTLLGVKETFRFDHKYQWGENAYLGLHIDNEEEVGGFCSGILDIAPMSRD